MGGKGKKMRENGVAILWKETQSGLPSLTFTEQSEFADKKNIINNKFLSGNCCETFLL